MYLHTTDIDAIEVLVRKVRPLAPRIKVNTNTAIRNYTNANDLPPLKKSRKRGDPNQRIQRKIKRKGRGKGKGRERGRRRRRGLRRVQYCIKCLLLAQILCLYKKIGKCI